MKKSPLFLIIGSLSVLLCSCGTPNLQVSRPNGEPLPGAYLEPVAIKAGCNHLCYTDPCGNLSVRSPQVAHLRHPNFMTIYNVPIDPNTTEHIIMTPVGNGQQHPGGYQYQGRPASK